jgi:hypothetical protein
MPVALDLTDAEALRRADEPWTRAEAFARRFSEPHVRLALHASVPTGFSPELVNLIRLNFVPDAPFIAEADLLLSPLCREVGGGLYEMDPPVREILQAELASDAQLGPARLARVAEFLLAYAMRELMQAKDEDTRAHLRTLQWTGLAHVAPELAAQELAVALGQSLHAGNSGEAVRLVRFTDSLASALAGQATLLRYAAGLGRLLQGDARSATRVLARLGDTTSPAVIAGVGLPSADDLLSTYASAEEPAAAAQVRVAPPDEEAGATFDVFVKYDSADHRVALRLAVELRARGVRAWIDLLELNRLTRNLEGIQSGIRASRDAVILIGAGGAGRWDDPESSALLGQRRARGMHFIPVLVPGAAVPAELPDFLRDVQVIDLRAGATAEAIVELARVIEATAKPAGSYRAARVLFMLPSRPGAAAESIVRRQDRIRAQLARADVVPPSTMPAGVIELTPSVAMAREDHHLFARFAAAQSLWPVEADATRAHAAVLFVSLRALDPAGIAADVARLRSSAGGLPIILAAAIPDLYTDAEAGDAPLAGAMGETLRSIAGSLQLAGVAVVEGRGAELVAAIDAVTPWRTIPPVDPEAVREAVRVVSRALGPNIERTPAWFSPEAVKRRLSPAVAPASARELLDTADAQGMVRWLRSSDGYFVPASSFPAMLRAFEDVVREKGGAAAALEHGNLIAGVMQRMTAASDSVLLRSAMNASGVRGGDTVGPPLIQAVVEELLAFGTALRATGFGDDLIIFPTLFRPLSQLEPEPDASPLITIEFDGSLRPMFQIIAAFFELLDYDVAVGETSAQLSNAVRDEFCLTADPSTAGRLGLAAAATRAAARGARDFAKLLLRAIRAVLPEDAVLQVHEHEALAAGQDVRRRRPGEGAAQSQVEAEPASAEQSQSPAAAQSSAAAFASGPTTVIAAKVIVVGEAEAVRRGIRQYAAHGLIAQDGLRLLSLPLEQEQGIPAVLGVLVAPADPEWPLVLSLQDAAAVLIFAGEPPDAALLEQWQARIRATPRASPIPVHVLSGTDVLRTRETVIASLDMGHTLRLDDADVQALAGRVEMLYAGDAPVQLYSEWVRRQSDMPAAANDAGAHLAGVRVLKESGVVITDPAWFEKTVLGLFARVRELGPEELPAARPELLIDSMLREKSRDPRLERAAIEAVLAELARVSEAATIETGEGRVVVFPHLRQRWYGTGSPTTMAEPLLEVSFTIPVADSFMLSVAHLAYSGRARLRGWDERAARFESLSRGAIWLVPDDERATRIAAYADAESGRVSGDFLREVEQVLRNAWPREAYVRSRGYA